MADLQAQLRAYGRYLDERADNEPAVGWPSDQTTDDAGDMPFRATTRKPAAAIRVLSTAAALVLVAVFAAILIRSVGTSDPADSSDSSWIVTIPLSEVPEGVSARVINGTPVFLLRRGEQVKTFLTDMHHIPGETVLVWCPKDEVFVSPTHGELFDRSGAVIGGPAQRGLDQLHTSVSKGEVRVDYARLLPDVRAPVRERTATFCTDGVRGGGRYRSPAKSVESHLEIDVADAGTFDAATYSTESGVVRIRFRSQGAVRYLRIEDSRLAGLEIKSHDKQGTATVSLPPGTYTLSASRTFTPDPATTTLVVRP
ncbi:MAG: hypothetical protein WDA60_04450 [Acidimicrobiia bacterium]|jgi:nitrite reductase/ring-hydroxylating ferredoxin subunit